MPAEVFFDSTILVYAVTQNDPRSTVARELLSSGGIVSVQGLNELVSVTRRKMLMQWDRIEEILSVMRELCGEPVPITAEIHDVAVQVSQRFSYHIYDSLMIAAAQHAGCTTLYSEDMQHGQKIGSLKIRNPFLA